MTDAKKNMIRLSATLTVFFSILLLVYIGVKKEELQQKNPENVSTVKTVEQIFSELVYDTIPPKTITIDKDPCPENDVQCLINVLEKLLPYLKHDVYIADKFNERSRKHSLKSHMDALAYGYAFLGNFKKAEKYRKASSNINPDKHKPRPIKLAPGAVISTGSPVIREYIKHGRDDLVFKALGKNIGGTCGGATQIYGFNKDLIHLEKALSEPKCNLYHISNICKYVSEDHFSKVHDVIERTYKELNVDEKTYSSWRQEKHVCLRRFAWKRKKDKRSYASSDLAKILNADLTDEEISRLRDLASHLYIREKRYDEAISEIRSITNFKRKTSQYAELIKKLAGENNLQALEYNKEAHEYIKENLKKTGLQKNYYYPDFKRAYSGSSETSFLLFTQIKDPVFRLEKLYHLLQWSKKGFPPILIHQDTKDFCSGDNFESCVFRELEKAYRQVKEETVENQKIHSKKLTPDELYRNAKILMGDLIEAEKYYKDNNNKLDTFLSENEAFCSKLFKDLVEKAKTESQNWNVPNYHPQHEFDCIYSSGRYLEAMPKDRAQKLEPWQELFLNRVMLGIKRTKRNVLKDAELLHLNFTGNIKNNIFTELLKIANNPQLYKISEELSAKLYQKLINYIEVDEKAKTIFYWKQYEKFKHDGKKDLADQLMQNNKWVAAEQMRIEQKKQERNEKEFKEKKLKDIGPIITEKLYKKIRENREYIPNLFIIRMHIR